jgi:hypothetical protein
MNTTKSIVTKSIVFLFAIAVLGGLLFQHSFLKAEAQTNEPSFCHHCIAPKVETQIAATACDEAPDLVDYFYSNGFTQALTFVRVSNENTPDKIYVCDVVAIKILQ